MKNSVWIITSVLLLWACNSTPEFTRVIDGKDVGFPMSTGLWYSEIILVKHTPRDTLERIKMMIAYYDSVGMSLSELKQRGDILGYIMTFWKDTRVTRAYFWETARLERPYWSRFHSEPDPNETLIGDISAFQLDDKNRYIAKVLSDSAKWGIDLDLNLGDEPDAKYIGANYRCYPLYDESDPDWWEHHKDSTMLQYDPIWDHICKDGRVINYFKKLQGDKLH